MFMVPEEAIIDTLLPVMTVQEFGWLDTEYSNVFCTGSLIAVLGGMFIGGALVDFFGKVRMMALFLFGLFVLVLTISVFATAMQLCWKRISASQFTLYMAVSNLGLSMGAWLLGLLASAFEYRLVILAYLVFALFSAALTRLVKLEIHDSRLASLETEP